jgi:RNA polymerase sigma-70 factor (ECF subfamily)
MRTPIPADEPTDAAIVERVRGGDRDAFALLVRRYQGRAYRLALRVLRDEEQARDAVQEALLKAYRSLGSFEGRSGFYTWLYRLVMNQCIDQIRRGKSDRNVEWEDEHSAPLALGAEGRVISSGAEVGEAPEGRVARSRLAELVARAMQQLPEDARRTLQLREIDGLEYAEIAKVLGIPKGTVMSRLHYARKRLRELLQQAGVEADAADLD